METPTEEQVEEMRKAFELICEFMAALRPVIEAILEALRKAWEAIKKLCSLLVKAASSWWRRALLCAWLESWHFPHWLAELLAIHWPERWLPAWSP